MNNLFPSVLRNLQEGSLTDANNLFPSILCNLREVSTCGRIRAGVV